ncbi:MAG: PQQ-binding-like beta-propeller repeat protein [Planctomycetaceae bacterium]
MPSCRRTERALLIVGVAWCLAGGALVAARADDWPQWMGPRRDNVWREEGIVERFPAGGPKVAWRVAVAGGYAGPAVADGRVFVTDFVPDADLPGDNFERETARGTERVLAFDSATGKELWRHEYPVAYTISYPAGPRCTPTVDGGRVYTLGAEGDLLCLDVADGRVVWAKDLKKDYETKAALWGWAGHPLVDGERLVVVAGTAKAHVVALDKATGKELWRAGTAPEQGYSPPTIIEAAGRRQLVLMKPDGMYAVDPESGAPLWETPYNADNGSIIMAPVQVGEWLYVGGFQEKNLLVKLAADAPGVEPVWRNKAKHGISAVNVQPFVDGDMLYGFHEKGDLRGVHIPSGEVKWSTPGPLGERPPATGTAFLCRHGDRFFLFAETGDLVIASIGPEGYRELDRAHLVDPTQSAFGRGVVWCPPAYAERSVFVRNDKELVRVSLAE